MSSPGLPLHLVGSGAVSPAGWGVEALVEAVRRGESLPVEECVRDENAPRQRFRPVPAPVAVPGFRREPRLRRTSPIAHFAVAAALEALGPERIARVREGAWRLGLVCVVTNGCVNFSRRFYAETLADPATASPLVFPETVFNAPSSHLAALLGAGDVNYTLVGDASQFFAAFDLAAQWLDTGEADGCLLVGAEELDWLTTEATALFDADLVVSEGAAAVYVEPAATAPAGAVLATPGRSWLISQRRSRAEAAHALRAEWADTLPAGAWLCDSRCGAPRTDAPEAAAWADWTGGRLPLGEILGCSFGAFAGWQAVAAAARLQTPFPPPPPTILLSHIGPTQLAHSLLLQRV